jgi:hypothetical protein
MVFQRTYGVYIIKGVEDAGEYTSMPVHGRLETMDQGDQVSSHQLTEADAIAEDLARQANEGILVPDGSTSFMGVFVSPTAVPSPKLLAEMQKKFIAFCDGQIRLANKFWDLPADHKNIGDLHISCARYRHVSPPWMMESTDSMPCPACGKSTPSGVAICATCGAVLDEQKARKFFPERFTAQEAVEADKPARTQRRPTPQQ